MSRNRYIAATVSRYGTSNLIPMRTSKSKREAIGGENHSRFIRFDTLRRRWILTILMATHSVFTAFAQPESPAPGSGGGPGGEIKNTAPVKETTAALEKWVSSRQVIAKTKRDWDLEKAAITNSIELFSTELKALEEGLQTATVDSSRIERETAELEASKAVTEAGLDAARILVTELEAAVTGLSIQLPPPLKDRIDPILKRIPAASEETKRSVMERMQNVVALVNEIDRFNLDVTVVSEVQTNPEGKEIQVQTVYLGLGQAYFVDRTGTHSGFGSPSENGWAWIQKPEIAGSVRTILSMYEGKIPAAFVPMPVQID